MAVPSTPTIAVIAEPGLINESVTLQSTGAGIDTYEHQVATNVGFTTGVQTVTETGVGGVSPAPSVGVRWAGLTPGTLYYFRARSHNASGYSAYSGVVTATVPARRALDVVEGASVVVDGITCSLRFNPATGAVQLGYSLLTDVTTWTVIATIDTAADFFVTGSIHDFALVANPAGDLYVVGAGRGAVPTAQAYVRARRFTRTATSTWVSGGTAIQSLTDATRPIVGFMAVYVLGSGGTPKDSIAVTLRVAGLGTQQGYAVLDVSVVNASGAAGLFLSSGSSRAITISGGPAAQALALITRTGGRIVETLSGTKSYATITNGIVGSLASITSSLTSSSKVRALSVDANTVAIVGVVAGDLVVRYYDTAGALLGSATYLAANAQGANFADQWDAYYNAPTGAVRVYYIADNAGARQLEYVDVSNVTYLVGTAVVVTAALGAASSGNTQVRIPQYSVDERRVLVEAGNLLTGVYSTAASDDRSGNLVPNAPALVDEAGYDAVAARLFAWAFSDGNASDSQSAYQLQIDNATTLANVVDTGKVVSTALSRNVAGATLANGVNYRWRVRTYDALDQVGAWSSYDTFTTAATGTLTITLPVADTASLDVATYDVTWTYVQVNGYTQTQRRVRVIRVSDGAVLSDTTMQASTVAHYVVSLPTGVAVRIEVSIVTNAPGTPTIGPILRNVTSSYSDPMAPTAVITQGADYLTITVTNPAPTGSRPEVISNLIERRETGSGDDFVAVARVGYGGVYHDHAVKSGKGYDYQVRGQTA